MVAPEPPPGTPAVPTPAPVPAPASAPAARAALHRWFARFKGPIVAIAGVGAVLSGLVGWYTTYNAVKTAASPPGAAASAAGAAAAAAANDAIYPLSIMVLPLANQTGDAGKAYVADGLTSSITSDLSRIRDAMVMAPAQAYAYKDKAASLQQIGREAGVRFIVQGALQASADKLRVAVQLAEASTGTLLWNETIEGSLADLFSLQDTVTQRVSASMDSAMIVSAARASESRKSNPRAVDLILRAKAEGLQPVSQESFQKIQGLYRQALKIEPDNVAAQFGLALALMLEVTNFSSKVTAAHSESATKEAQDLATRALQREPDSPRGLGVLWAIARNTRDCPKLATLGPARLALEPNSPNANMVYGFSVSLSGQPAQGIPYIKRALELNPRKFGIAKTMLGASYVMLGDHAAAIPWLLQGIQVQPKFPDTYAWLALAYQLQGDKEQLKSAMAQLQGVAPGFRANDLDPPGDTCSQAEKEFWDTHVAAVAQRAGIPR